MLYDDILAEPPAILVECDRGHWQQKFMEEARRAVRVKADNVAEYLFVGNEKDEWDLATDFPACVPPFPVTWVEWVIPAKINIGGTIRRIENPGSRCAALLVCHERDHMPVQARSDDEKIRTLHAMRAGMDPGFGEYMRKHRGQIPPYSAEQKKRLLEMFEQIEAKIIRRPREAEDWRWMVTIFFVLRLPGPAHLVVLAPMIFHFMLSPHGQMLPVDENDSGLIYYQCVAFSPDTEEALPPSTFFIPFLTLSFLNCKNVRRVEVRPPEKLNKARVRRGKLPLVSHYTLEITPMQEVLRREGKSETLGLKRALHLCRGHFADYTEGKGLFGKHHGQFWVPQHVRGDAKHGTIEKDYSVNPVESARA